MQKLHAAAIKESLQNKRLPQANQPALWKVFYQTARRRVGICRQAYRTEEKNSRITPGNIRAPLA